MFVKTKRDFEPKTIEQAERAVKSKTILYASLGGEAGWPALQKISLTSAFNGNVIREITRKIGQRSISQINEFPFESISLLPSIAVHWLNHEVSEADYNFIKSLPKVELHCHLGGFATHDKHLEIVRNAQDDSFLIEALKSISYPENWPLPSSTIPLDEYMRQGDNGGSYILKNIGCLNKQIDLLYSHLNEQNIGYAEIRCSPYNYTTENFTGLDILQIIQKRFDENMAKANEDLDFWCHVNLLIIATRTDKEDMKKIEDHLFLAMEAESNSNIEGRCKIVGVDLAGFEHSGTRASYFNTQFEPIHKKGMALTIHAGENDDSDAIWDAVFKLNTRRIGHGLNLYQDQNLLKSVINRRIGIELCPYANYQIKGYFPMEGNKNVYPLCDYLRKGAAVTINTDNIGISNASLTENIMLAAKMNPELTKMEILQIIRNGIEQAFIDINLKNRIIQIFNSKIYELIFTSRMQSF